MELNRGAKLYLKFAKIVNIIEVNIGTAKKDLFKFLKQVIYCFI
jgi:hypothetical protein